MFPPNLPQIQPPGAVPGPRSYGQQMGGYGLQPYPPNFGNSMVQMLLQSIEGYKDAVYLKKQMAQKDVENALRLKSLGIPIDNAKLAKDLKLSGIPVDLEGPSTQEMQYASQARQQEALQQQMMMPPVQMQSSSPQIGEFNVEMGPQRTPAPTGMPPVENLKSGQVSQYAPIVQALNAMDNRMMERQQLENTQMDVQRGQMSQAMQLQKLYIAGLQGDPRAIEMLSRTGLWQTLGPSDQMLMLAAKAGYSPERAAQTIFFASQGGPEMFKARMDTVNKIAERMGGDLQKARDYLAAIEEGKEPQFKPQMTVDEWSKMTQEYVRMRELYPEAPGNLIDQYLHYGLVGNNEMASKVLEHLGRYKTNKQIQNEFEGKRFTLSEEGQLWDQKFRAQMLGFDQRKFALSHELEVLKTVKGIASQEFDNWFRLATLKQANGKVDEDQLKEATKGLVSAIRKHGDIEYRDPFTGQVKKIGGNQVKSIIEDNFFTSDKSYVGMEDTSSVVDKSVGTPSNTRYTMPDWMRGQMYHAGTELYPMIQPMTDPFQNPFTSMMLRLMPNTGRRVLGINPMVPTTGPQQQQTPWTPKSFNPWPPTPYNR